MDMMNLLKVAVRVAGGSLTMVRELNDAPQSLINRAENFLIDSGLSYDDKNILLGEAIKAACKTSGFTTEEFPNYDDPINFIHELEHLLLDPSFSLIEGKSKTLSFVDSYMDEAITWAVQTGGGSKPDKEVLGTVSAVAGEYMYPGAESVSDAIGMIASEPIKSDSKKRIRKSAIHHLKTVFSDRLDASLDENVGEEFTKVYKMGSEYPLWIAVSHAFLSYVYSKYGDHLEFTSNEVEEKWKRFTLHLKNELRKRIPVLFP